MIQCVWVDVRESLRIPARPLNWNNLGEISLSALGKHRTAETTAAPPPRILTLSCTVAVYSYWVDNRTVHCILFRSRERAGTARIFSDNLIILTLVTYEIIRPAS